MLCTKILGLKGILIESTSVLLTDNNVSLAYIDGFMHERRNSIADALELHLSCANPSI